MYKLVAVGGKIRGQEFTLQEGANIFGRGMECKFQVDLQGISKKHMEVSVRDEYIEVQDLGSANGTFVNGSLVRKKVLNIGDQVAIPNAIFQVVYIKEKIKVVTKKVAKSSDDGGEFEGMVTDRPPENPVGKIIYYFKHI